MSHPSFTGICHLFADELGSISYNKGVTIVDQTSLINWSGLMNGEEAQHSVYMLGLSLTLMSLQGDFIGVQIIDGVCADHWTRSPIRHWHQ